MSLFGKAQKCAVCVVFCLLLSGCFPPGDNMDEKKDPNFITGKNLISQMDWNGAIEAFEKALDSNPRSASAHFELGWLYGEKATERDPAAAIYHYQRFLKLDPNSDKADVVKQFINTYKLELVKSVSAVGPMASGAQRELERVLAENKDLQGQIGQLQSQVTQLRMTAQVNANKPQVSSEPVTPLPPPVRVEPIPVPVPARSSGTTVRTEIPRSTSNQTSSQPSGRSVGSGTARTHVVKARETMASIARQYNVSIAALQSANPGARPTHLVVGQTLKIPAP